MIFTPTDVEGVVLLGLDRHSDERGFFARTFCSDTFEGEGISITVAQSNVSYNAKRGTLRGMHYQAPPHAEAKLVRCTQGQIYDVILDLRPSAPTFFRTTASELRRVLGSLY